MAAADLAVADDRAAEALAEVEVGEVVERAGPRRAVRSARAAQFTSLSTATGPSTSGGEDVGRDELADQERRVGQVHEAAGGRSTGSAALTTARRTRPGARLRTAGRRCSAAATCAGPAGSGTAATARAITCAVDVDGLGDDAVGRDAHGQRGAEVVGQRVVASRPAPRPVVRSPVSRPARPRSSRRTLSRRRWAWRCRSARRARPGSAAARSISARSTCSSVSDRSRSSDGFGRGHDRRV